jgi:hypothetical protein
MKGKLWHLLQEIRLIRIKDQLGFLRCEGSAREFIEFIGLHVSANVIES